MKTAEEIVNNCPSVKIGIDDFYGKQTFIKAIEQAQKEALRWRDPKEELPENGEPVIVKYMTARGIKKYGIAKYFELGIGNPWTIEGSTGREVIGWRPIE